jgi:hypothetical protein
MASQAPSAFDAVVLKGFSSNATGGIQFVASLNLQISSLSLTRRFSGKQDGYLLLYIHSFWLAAKKGHSFVTIFTPYLSASSIQASTV